MSTYTSTHILPDAGATYTTGHSCIDSGATAIRLEIGGAHSVSVHVQPGDELNAAAALTELAEILTDRHEEEQS